VLENLYVDGDLSEFRGVSKEGLEAIARELFGTKDLRVHFVG
jgi:hypothetical protein